MRRVVLVRHAKSDWTDRSLDDHDRPLAPRGVRALERMRSHLADSVAPDLVLCSSARRTLDTLDGIRAAFPDDVEIRVEGRLYDATASGLTDLLRRVDAAVTSVVLVGHNPALHDLALELVDDDRSPGDVSGWERLVSKFPTGAIATLSLAGAWSEVGPGCATLDGFFTPRGDVS